MSMDLQVQLEDIETSELTWVDAVDACDYENHKVVDSTGFDDLPFTVDESTNLDHLHDFAEAVEGRDEDEVKAVCETFPYTSPSLSDLADCFREQKYTAYQCRNMEELAEQFVDEGLYGTVPDALKGYIDFEKLGRDLQHDGYEESSYGYVIRYD